MKRLLWMLAGLLVIGIVMEGCRRQPLDEHTVRKTLAEKQEQRNVDIERSVQTAPPPIEIPSSPPANSGKPQGQAVPQGETPSYTPPPPLTSGAPSSSSTAPTAPTDARIGDIQLDPTTGQYGIAPPGAPPGYTIPLHNTPGDAK